MNTAQHSTSRIACHAPCLAGNFPNCRIGAGVPPCHRRCRISKEHQLFNAEGVSSLSPGSRSAPWVKPQPPHHLPRRGCITCDATQPLRGRCNPARFPGVRCATPGFEMQHLRRKSPAARFPVVRCARRVWTCNLQLACGTPVPQIRTPRRGSTIEQIGLHGAGPLGGRNWSPPLAFEAPYPTLPSASVRVEAGADGRCAATWRVSGVQCARIRLNIEVKPKWTASYRICV